jgi:hypothetical protein
LSPIFAVFVSVLEFVPRKSTIGVVEHGFFTGAGPWGRVVQCPRKKDVPMMMMMMFLWY